MHAEGTMSGYAFAVLEEGPYKPRDTPTWEQLQKVGQLGLDLGVEERRNAINSIGAHLYVPAGGWHNQIKLFENGDIRLRGVLTLLAQEAAARYVAANLASAARYVNGNLLLALVTAQREHASSLTAHSARMVDSFWEGGLDHLGQNKNKLGLPRSVTDGWGRITPYRNPDAQPRIPGDPNSVPLVHPAMIAARDQMLIYAAQINSSYEQALKGSVRAALGLEADATLARLKRVGKVVWQAFAFLAPGGKDFDHRRSLHEQIDQYFGSRTAVQYLVHRARAHDARAAVDLNDVYRDAALNRSAWVKSAKTRAVETLFLERLLTTVRELVF
jgi:hypothetical protein